MGYPHPDYLLPLLTAEQFMDWEKYHAADSWGESRADDRAAAGLLWNRNAGVPGAIPPSLFGPEYFAEMDPEHLGARARALDGEIDRVLKHLEERKKRG